MQYALTNNSNFKIILSFHRLLADLTGVKYSTGNDRSAILLDLYYYSLVFAREHDFNQEQTSAFFSIVKQVHELCTGTVTHNLYTLCGMLVCKIKMFAEIPR